MEKRYYAQKDQYGFPIPGTLMSVKNTDIIPEGTLEIPPYDVIPNPSRKGQGSELRYFVRHKADGSIIPNSLIASLKRPEGMVYEYQVPGDGINDIPTMVVITDSIPHAFPLSWPSVRLFCNGVTSATKYTSAQGIASMGELVALFNADSDMSTLGYFSAAGPDTLRLTMGPTQIAQHCSLGSISMNLFED